MIVGQTGSGKSVSWQMLQLVLSTMKKEGVAGYNLVKVNKLGAETNCMYILPQFFACRKHFLLIVYKFC